jgi:stage III sporulation protein SpoIIIAA/intein/homing endonuclease
MSVREIVDDLDKLLAVLPPRIRTVLEQREDLSELLEVVLDLGRKPEARFPDKFVYLSDEPVTREDIDYVVERIGEFNRDNRAGIEGTLHRISCIRNRSGRIVGLTCRVGRAVFGTVNIIRDIVESGKNILLLGRPGVGKCVAPDTLVATAEGLTPIGSFATEFSSAGEFCPLQTAVASLRGWAQVTHGYYDGIQPTIKVTTRYGFQLEGTANHCVLVMGENGRLTWRPLSELREGDFVAIARGHQCFGMETDLPPFRLQRKTNARTDLKFPESLTPELARLLGYLTAEGTLTHRYFVSFSNRDPEVQKDMQRLVRNLFGVPLEKHLLSSGWDGKDFRIPTKALRAFLEHLGLKRVRTEGKEVPQCILKAPSHLVSEFLRGLFEGDGSVTGVGIEVSSASEKLLRQVQLLLLGFGIVARLRPKRVKDKVCRALTLKGKDAAEFARTIGFLSRKKKQAAEKLYRRKRNSNCDIVPFAWVWLRQLHPLISVPKGHYSRLVRFARGDRSPSYTTLNAILRETEHLKHHPAWQYLRQLCDLHFFFDRVVKREQRKSPVYDFVVVETHAFVANGFINHNTTKLREIARILADEFGKRVIVVDTSNEIAGDGDVPHPGIGLARRMQVPSPEKQADVMIEAVENHMPEVIIVDEIGRKEEADAARTIAERGVQLIATAHGNTLENLVANPLLCDLVGGIQAVTLSDEEARRRGTQKTVLERKAPPTFDIIVELIDRHKVAIHHDAAKAVDALLRGQPVQPEIREELSDGSFRVLQAAREPQDESAGTPTALLSRERGGRVYAYGVSRKHLERASILLGIPLKLVNSPNDSDFILTLESHLRKGHGNLRAIAERGQKPVFAIRSNTYTQVERILRLIFGISRTPEEELAIREAEAAVQIVLEERRPVELTPVGPNLRKLQHQVAERYHLPSESIGREPRRRVVIYPNTD